MAQGKFLQLFKNSEYEGFDGYDAYELPLGDFIYLDVKAVPIGLFGLMLVRIFDMYKAKKYKYVSKDLISQNDDRDYRMVIVFEKVG